MKHKKSRKFWNEIINGKKLLNDKEAEEMLDMVKKLRKMDFKKIEELKKIVI